MSILKMAEVWASAEVEGSELLVLLALADFANDDGSCWPSVATVAKKSRLTERGTRGIIRRLEKQGLVSTVISTGGAGHSSKYRVIANPEPASGLGINNPERGCNKPGTVVPPNLKRTTTKKDSDDSTKKGTRLSENWTLPKLWGEWATSQLLNRKETLDQADRFRDYWIAIPGQRGVKRDWLATWRNWVRSAAARGDFANGGASKPREQTASDHIMRELNLDGEGKVK